MVGRLRTSTSVRQVLRTMKGRFHQCLSMCKSLDVSGSSATNDKRNFEGLTADKLIYNYAIEMCQSAALEELFGLPEEVMFRRTHVNQSTNCLFTFTVLQALSDCPDLTTQLIATSQRPRRQATSEYLQGCCRETSLLSPETRHCPCLRQLHLTRSTSVKLRVYLGTRLF